MTRFLTYLLPTVLAATLLAGCATNKVDWANRVGNYTFDQAVIELGPPDKSAKLSDGTTVAEWLTRRGNRRTYLPWYDDPGYQSSMSPWPDRFLRLIFNPEGHLKTWQNIER